jgi:hypothetical protein
LYVPRNLADIFSRREGVTIFEHMRRARGRLYLTIAASLLAAWAAAAPPASAAEYRVEVCTQGGVAADGVPASAGEGISTGLVGEPGPIFVHGCDAGVPESGAVELGGSGGTAHAESEGFLRLSAPSGAKIVHLEVTQSFSHDPFSFLRFVLFTSAGQTLFSYIDDGRVFFPPTERRDYAIEAGAVQGSVFCPPLTGGLCTGGPFDVTLQNIVAVLDDGSPPVFFGAPSLPAGALRGVVPVRISAFDPGSGIASADLIVDGKPLPPVHEDNGGHCHEPFKYVLPCAASLNGSLPLDTSPLSDGVHRVEIALVDATGQETVSGPLQFTVHNAPVNVSRPVIRGENQVKGRLSAEPGRWLGAPSAFAYQWLRCPASTKAEGDTAGCVPISGAQSAEYVLGRADRGHRDLVQVTASNGAGSGLALSLSTEVIGAERSAPGKAPGPAISHVVLSRKRFRVIRGRKKAHRGAVLSFNCSKGGELSLQIQILRGKRKPKPISKLIATIKQGRSSVLLSGEIGGGRLLVPGRYQVTLRVRDAKGRYSEPVVVPFRVLPG